MKPDGNPQIVATPLADRLREWDPTLDVYELDSQGRLYEPDGTLYAIALRETSLVTDRRRQAVGRGDLVVIPRAVAVDLDPEGDFLALLDLGPPPYHFRERFIQVWGFEHAALPPAEIMIGEPTAVLHDEQARHRISYHSLLLGPGTRTIESSSVDAILAIVLDGDAMLRGGGDDEPAGRVVFVPPGGRAVASGPGRIGLLGLSTELAHQARRVAAQQGGSRALSPELDPARDPEKNRLV